eukprot:Em0003g1257a
MRPYQRYLGFEVRVAGVVIALSLVWFHVEAGCQQGQFDCARGTGIDRECISQQQVCDGQNNCAGGQDENPGSCHCIQRKALGPTLLPSVANRAAAAAAGARKSPARVHTGRRLAGIVQGPNNGLLSAVDSACVCIATNSSSVVCSCAVGFVSDGQSGCKSETIRRHTTRPVLQADCACASGLVPPLAPPVPVPIPALSLLSEQPQLLLQSQKAQLFVQSWQSQLSLQPHQS